MTINLYYVGRIVVRQKRLDELINFFQIFYNQKKFMTIHIFGSGESSLIGDIKSCANNFIDIRFYGYKDNWIEYVSDDWIQLFFSDYEGCPLTLLEAMKAGKRKMASLNSPGLTQYMSKNCIFQNLYHLAESIGSDMNLENNSNLSIYFDQLRFMRDVKTMEEIINA
jgi:glycosyltransferase involved in cell wall biosynthesis